MKTKEDIIFWIKDWTKAEKDEYLKFRYLIHEYNLLKKEKSVIDTAIKKYFLLLEIKNLKNLKRNLLKRIRYRLNKLNK